MSQLGIAEREIATLLLPLRAPGEAAPSAPELTEFFARAAWTGIAEPGDRAAGLLVTALGAGGALAAVIEQWPATRVIAEVDPQERAGRAALGREVSEALERWRPRLNSAAAVRALQSAAHLGCRLSVPDDAEWPAGVDDLGVHAPIALWWRGQAEAMVAMGRSFALVGARAATGYGEHITMEASAGLVDRGFAIVSGAAYGVDGMAHRAALASRGITVAFLAGGLDRFYPSGHDALLTRIVQSGAVLSELPCGASPTRWRFLQRNRLIATASQATVVLEAGHRSGSLNTAGHAAAAGRPLGAVPGPVTSPASAGCHRLLRDYDARCVTNAAEMAELVEPDAAAPPAQQESGAAASPEEVRVLDALSTRSARGLNDVAARSGMAPSAVMAVLGMLELDGRAREDESGWRRRLPA